MIDIRIHKYLDGQLTEKEKAEFEIELENSSELRNELNKAKDLLFKLKSMSEVKSDSSYFGNILPEFRNKANKGKRLNPAFVFGLSSIIVFIVLFYLFSDKTDKDIIKITNELSDEEFTETINQFYDEYTFTDLDIDNEAYDSLMNSVLYDELNISYYSENLASQFDPSESFEELSEEEAEIIYKEIINKKFF
jgi:hypothetical protein